MTSEQRLAICKKCPLCKTDPTFGPTCDSSKWMNKVTGETSRIPHTGWIKGCGCKLQWKTRNLTSHCIAGKW